MKKMALIGGFLFLVLIMPGIVLAAPAVSIGNYEIMVGETAFIEVILSDTASAAGDIDGFQFRVSYDSNNLLASNAGSDIPLFNALGGASIANGLVTFGYDGFGLGAIGDSVLGYFDLTGLTRGNYSLNFSDVKLLSGFDPALEPPTDVVVNNGSINVVPIPPAILLLGGGLVGLIGLRRRKSS